MKQLIKIALCGENDAQQDVLVRISERWGLVADEQSNMALTLASGQLRLHRRDADKPVSLVVDFLSPALTYRRRSGGGRSEAIAKAAGIKKGISTVLDATAGLGRDAFILAGLGCRVQMFERHPVMAALLENGLQRAYEDHETTPWLKERLKLFHACSLKMLSEITDQPDVVYLDPMYPHRKKSALVKKEMRLVQALIGADQDADALLAPALALAKKRVVVKRPSYAPPLAGLVADAVITTKNHRFDLYFSS